VFASQASPEWCVRRLVMFVPTLTATTEEVARRWPANLCARVTLDGKGLLVLPRQMCVKTSTATTDSASGPPASLCARVTLGGRGPRVLPRQMFVKTSTATTDSASGPAASLCARVTMDGKGPRVTTKKQDHVTPCNVKTAPNVQWFQDLHSNASVNQDSLDPYANKGALQRPSTTPA